MKAEGGTQKESVSTARSFILHPSSFIIAFGLGALTVLGFAPFYFYPLPVAALAGLFYLWSRAERPRAAAATGFAYGLGLFLFGVSWIYVSLHDFGAMPAPLAAVATFLFCAFLALFPAAVGYVCARPSVAPAARFALLAPAIWTLAEWTRSWIFTGFPWLALGYSQVPSSLLSGYAPALGIYGVSLATATSAGLIVSGWLAAADKAEGGRLKAESKKRTETFILHPSSFILRCALLFLLIGLGGWALKQAEWTQPAGAPLRISLLQANIAQDLKWNEDRIVETLETYRALVMLSQSPLIVLPETALPLFLERVPKDYLAELAAHARKNGGDILVGVPERQPGGEYYNSVVSFGTAPTQTYRKSHLVPFGEFIPLRPLLGAIVGALAIPLQDFSRGTENQRPLAVAGQLVAVNICYEDAFGEEIIRQLPEATLLVNVSNVAWFGRSIAPRQHLQISQARALETGRPMLRATNTGVTGVIGPDGELREAAPEFTVATVTHRIQGYGGATLYVRWGNAAVLVLCLVLIAITIGMRYAARSAA